MNPYQAIRDAVCTGKREFMFQLRDGVTAFRISAPSLFEAWVQVDAVLAKGEAEFVRVLDKHEPYVWSGMRWAKINEWQPARCPFIPLNYLPPYTPEQMQDRTRSWFCNQNGTLPR